MRMAKLITAIFTLIALSWTDILEVIADMHNSGASWGAIITGLLLWSKLKNNKRLQELDERMEAKLDAIMRHRGVPWDWDAEKRALQSSTAPMLFKWLHRVLYHAQGVALYTVRRVIDAFRLRRGNGMNQTINYAVLLSAIIGALKLILQPFGIDLTAISDENINAMANGFAALLVIIGIVRDNISRLRGGQNNAQGTTGDHGPMR
jgi:uncharacterized membrane protein